MKLFNREIPRLTLFFLWRITIGCSSTVEGLPGYVGTHTDLDGGPAVGFDAPEVSVLADGGVLRDGVVVACAPTTCPTGYDCCLLTGTCFDRADRSACPLPPPDAGVTVSQGDPGSVHCTSNSDCALDAFCWIRTPFYTGCLGEGVCIARDNAGTCFPEGSPGCQVCGCDGVTYASPAAAWAVGVNYHSGPCGTSMSIPDAGPDGSTVVYPAPCGAGSACPGSETCCSITGQCYDSTCSGCCQMPPSGTVGPCGSNADCPDTGPLCQGTAGCGSSGFCVTPPGGCTGAFTPVCGCDGVTYINACEAGDALTLVAHTGPCAM